MGTIDTYQWLGSSKKFRLQTIDENLINSINPSTKPNELEPKEFFKDMSNIQIQPFNYKSVIHIN